MRIPGYCIRCHRIKQIRVSGHGLAMMKARGGVAQGTCSSCEDKENEKRNVR